MKTIRYIFKKQIILLMMLSVFCLKGQAQVEDKLHFNVDWQMNAPISTDFADKISGWGMNFEAGYYVTSRWSLGAFLTSSCRLSNYLSVFPLLTVLGRMII